MDDKRGPWRVVTPWGEKLDFDSVEALRTKLAEDPRMLGAGTPSPSAVVPAPPSAAEATAPAKSAPTLELPPTLELVASPDSARPVVPPAEPSTETISTSDLDPSPNSEDEPLSAREIEVTQERVPRVFTKSRTPPPSPTSRVPIVVETSKESKELARSLMPPPVALGGALEEAALRRAALEAEAQRAERAAAKAAAAARKARPKDERVPWAVVGAVLGGIIVFMLMRSAGDAPKPATDPMTTTEATPIVTAQPPPAVTPPPPSSAPGAATSMAPEARVPAAAMMGGGAGHPAVGSAPPAETTAAADASTSAPVAPVVRPVSTATLVDTLRQARTARNSGDTARAHDLYQQAVALSPDDADALVGLGDLARAQGKNTDARSYFEHALIGTPSNVSALLGLADTLWDLDNKDQARARYAEVLRRAPTGTYPERVKDRAQ